MPISNDSSGLTPEQQLQQLQETRRLANYATGVADWTIIRNQHALAGAPASVRTAAAVRSAIAFLVGRGLVTVTPVDELPEFVELSVPEHLAVDVAHLVAGNSTVRDALLGDGERAVLKAASVDPGLLRWCQWPGCLASYVAVPGPTEPGWARRCHSFALLCPKHDPLGHHPDWELNPSDLSYLTALCSCGGTAEVRPANAQAVLDWWERHVTALPAATE